MVVKTELCAFSEYRVYPGHGARFVTRTGQLVVLGGSKVTSLYHQKKKPAKLVWTQAWRRAHKKLAVESAAKRRARKVVKVQKSFVGLNLDALKQKRAAAAAAPKAAAPADKGAKAPKVAHASVAEAKAKAKAQAAARKAAAPAGKSHAGRGR